MASLQLGTYNGDPRTVNKLNNITWVNNETFVELENGSNIKHYIIRLEGVDTYFNYAKINGLYYFVKPVNDGSNTNNTFEFDLDYYYSYKDVILNTECIIERSSSHSNAYLKDNDFVLSTKTETITKMFPQGINNDTIILMTVG